MSETNSSISTVQARPAASGRDIAALIFGILVPIVGLILALIGRSASRKAGQPPSVIAVAALIVSSVLSGLWLIGLTIAGLGAALFFARGASAPIPMDTAPPASVHSSSEVVMTVHSSSGSPLTDADYSAVREVIDYRLANAGVTSNAVYLTGGEVHVGFGDDVDSDGVTAAARALDGDYRADFLPVIEAGACNPTLYPNDLGFAGQSYVCDNDATEGLLLGNSALSGDTIAKVTSLESTNSAGVSTGTWAVMIDFDEAGTAAFANLTRSLVNAGPGHDRLAIMLDGQLLSAPTVTSEITGGQVQISGNFSEADTEALARQLELAARGLVFEVSSSTISTNGE
jgi:hypothetical protein